jgi:hypothetical protein
VKYVECPRCRGYRRLPVEVASPANPFEMRPCPDCRGVGKVYVEVRSAVAALTRPASLAARLASAVLSLW